MKTLSNLANSMIYGDIVCKIAKERDVGLIEAKMILSEMSFAQYRLLTELITPPSGQTIGPTGSTGSSSTPGSADLAKPTPTAQPSPMTKGVAAASGGLPTPPQIGQTVNVPGPNNLPIPVQLTRVDSNKNTVRYKSPITGRDEDIGIDKLTPAATSNNSPDSGNAVAGAGGTTGGTSQVTGGTGQVAEDAELNRLLELAGIQEDCSGGATGAGAIAMAPTSMGKIKRREPAEEALTKEYTPKKAAETIVGDTKPNQASGELSSNLAASGKNTASRAFNGQRSRRVR